MDTRQLIEERLREALSPALLVVEDESAAHAGHVGARAGGGHFRVSIVCEAFAGRSQLERQRMVYAALSDAMGKGLIHAVSMETLSPQETK